MFKLQTPIKAQKNNVIVITQDFGENAVDFYKKKGLLGHNGIDFYTQNFEKGHAPITAAHDGYVISDATKQSPTAGIFVKLLSDETMIDNRACKVMTIYFHLQKCRVSITDDPQVKSETYWVRKGERYIKAGQLIGYGNNSGEYTTGAHLHFGMYILWKRADGTFVQNFTNGYDGAVNPQPYLLDDQLYQRSSWFGSKWYYNGKQITRREANTHIVPPPWF